ncbi:MAG TPA: COX15/CtaA family protein, partial [Thermoguttaceae bacterium]|nr:COX15/CtaA family protein [Thermoguttaceae bacterium]
PWPHRLAWVLVCAVFPLIWLGSTVTTYSAGMAVPDWPGTYGHWIWYPVDLWFGVWDLFLEHGHRLLARSVGLITITLAVVLWRQDPRRWMRKLAMLAVAGVVFQGTLGGIRVLWTSDWLAKVHGCTAPLFFALCAVLVTLTSQAWWQLDASKQHPAARHLHRLTVGSTVAVYLLIVLGAQLRHLAPGESPGWFELWVWLKLMLAGLTLATLVWLVVFVRRQLRDETALRRRATLLASLFFVQLILGAATWVTNYEWPAWFTNYVWAVEYRVVAEGRLQVIFTTAHTAVGSLVLVAALSLTIWSFRLLRAASGSQK